MVKKYLKAAVSLAMGAVIGAVIGLYIIEKLPMLKLGTGVFWVLPFLAITLYIHIVLHEGGHLVCGLITGYRFVSFRVGSVIAIKQQGGIILKRFTIAGTGGQCLLQPPPMDEEDNFPYVWYNLGGGLSNIIIAGLCAIIYTQTNHLYGGLFCLCMVAVGILTAATNLIPQKVGGVANDGYNIYAMGKNKLARQGLWLQLTIHGETARGVRLKDMPKQWFVLPEDADFNNPLASAIALCRWGYLHDTKDFEAARTYARHVLKDAPKMMGVHKNEFLCELLFYDILDGQPQSEIDKKLTRELRRYLKATKSYPSRVRLWYAYELLIKQDVDAAIKQRQAFKKAIERYPYPGEIAAEIELLAYIDEKAKEQPK